MKIIGGKIYFSEKFGGVFIKFPGSGYFPEFWIYFSVIKYVEYVYSHMDRSHGLRCTGPQH
jgi:hypothetical protein